MRDEKSGFRWSSVAGHTAAKRDLGRSWLQHLDDFRDARKERDFRFWPV
jgi:hypothetical protein